MKRAMSGGGWGWAWRMAVAVVWACLSAQALAQVRTEGLAMPKPLQGLPAAGTACARHAEAGGATDPGGVALPAPDPACAVSVNELVRDKALAEVVWVDVRRPEQADADPWPGALRLSPDALRTKVFLRGKRIVLLGEGRGQAALLSHCRRLKAEGFARTRVLQGGVPQWRLHEALAAVPPLPLPPPVSLDGAGLWTESLDEGNLVIGHAGDGLVSQLPFASQVDTWSVEAVRGLIERRRKATALPLSAIVLATTPERAASLPLDALRQALWPTPVLLHSGSAPALRAQLQQLEATWRARERGPKQPRCGQ